MYAVQRIALTAGLYLLFIKQANLTRGKYGRASLADVKKSDYRNRSCPVARYIALLLLRSLATLSAFYRYDNNKRMPPGRGPETTGMRGLFVHGQGYGGTCSVKQYKLRVLVAMLGCLMLTMAHAEQEKDEDVVTTGWARASATTGGGCANDGDCKDRVHTSSSWYGGSDQDGGGLRTVPVEERDGEMYDTYTSGVDDESAWCADQRKECNKGCSAFGDMLGSVMFRCDKDETGGTEAALCVCRDENGAALRSSSRAGAVQAMGAARSSASSMAGLGLGHG